MTRIDFYVLADADDAQRLEVVCKLAEKAVSQSKRVFIHTECSVLAESLDSALWEYRDDSFLPHCTLADDDATAASSGAAHSNQVNEPTVLADGSVAGTTPRMEPIAIGQACKHPDSARSVLINLGEEVPPFFSRFERTLEVINQREDIRDSGRKRYSYYQQRGYPLAHHKMS